MHKFLYHWSGVAASVTALVWIFHLFCKNNKPIYYSKPVDTRRLNQLSININQKNVEPVSDLTTLLCDIHTKVIMEKDHYIIKKYKIITTVFDVLHEKMKEADKYYEKYALTKTNADTQYDRLCVEMPDEYNVDVIIALPINFKYNKNDPFNSNMSLEYHSPRYVKLKLGKQFTTPSFKNNWHINMTSHKWFDDKGYMLRTKFLYWFVGVLMSAIAQINREENGKKTINIDCELYTIQANEKLSNIKVTIEKVNNSLWKEDEFECCFNIVPSIKLPENCWPVCGRYRSIPEECSFNYWRLVPKSDNYAYYHHVKKRLIDGLMDDSFEYKVEDDLEPFMSRAWMIDMSVQEYRLYTTQLRSVSRIIKRVRTNLHNKKFSDYFIDTLFYNEIMYSKNDLGSDEGEIFKTMIKKLYEAVDKLEISYFWCIRNVRESNLSRNSSGSRINLLGPMRTLKNPYRYFKIELLELIAILEDESSYRDVAPFILNEEEYKIYKGTKKQRSRFILWRE